MSSSSGDTSIFVFLRRVTEIVENPELHIDRIFGIFSPKNLNLKRKRIICCCCMSFLTKNIVPYNSLTLPVPFRSHSTAEVLPGRSTPQVVPIQKLKCTFHGHIF